MYKPDSDLAVNVDQAYADTESLTEVVIESLLIS